MNTIAPLPNCQVCNGSGKTLTGFCPCLTRPNDNVDIFTDGWGMKMAADTPAMTAEEAQRMLKQLAQDVKTPNAPKG